MRQMWWWAWSGDGRAGLLLLKEGAWEGKERPGHTQKARATGVGLVSCLVISVEGTEDHCPSGRLSPSPTYNYSPCFSSSSTGCKSKSGRHRGDGGTVVILISCPVFGNILFGLCLQGVLCTVTKGPPKSCASSSQVQHWPCQPAVAYVLSANYTKNVFLTNFFSYKGHLNDIWLSKQDILWTYTSLPTPVFAFPALASDINVCHCTSQPLYFSHGRHRSECLSFVIWHCWHFLFTTNVSDDTNDI